MKVISAIDDFIWPNKYLLSILGFWPKESDGTNIFRLFACYRIIFSMFVISTMFVPEIYTIIIYWGNISMLTEVGSVTIEVSQLIFKMFYMLARRRKFQQIYESAKKLWLITEDQEEREHIEKLARLANRITITLFLTGLCNVFTFVPVSIILTISNYRRANNSQYIRYLPLEMRYGIDTQHSPNFEIALCCQTIAMVYCVIGIAGFDATMMTLILHVSGQFRLISARFRAIGKVNKYGAESKTMINQCIDHHQKTIKIATEIKDILSPVILVQLMSSGLEICLSGYSLIVEGGSSADMTKYVIYIITMFMQLLVWCWPGELLIEDSTAVANVVCHEVPWYLLSTEQQRDLNFVIVRAQKKCCVTALDFQVMSLSKLTEVFNTAASYFALLRRMNEKSTTFS